MASQKIVGIYRITNIGNEMVYIGQSRDVRSRVKSHLSLLQRYKHDNIAMQDDWMLYGPFEYDLIEECSEDELNPCETYWIDYYDCLESGYNKTTPDGRKATDYLKRDLRSFEGGLLARNYETKYPLIKWVRILVRDGGYTLHTQNGCYLTRQGTNLMEDYHIDIRFYVDSFGHEWAIYDSNHDGISIYKGTLEEILSEDWQVIL